MEAVSQSHDRCGRRVKRTVEEQGAGVVVGRHALQQRQGVADSVGCRGGQLRRVEKGIDGDDFLQEGGHDAWAESASRSRRGGERAVKGMHLPNECHRMSASSGTCSRFLLSSSRAASLVFSLSRSAT